MGEKYQGLYLDASPFKKWLKTFLKEHSKNHYNLPY